MGQSDEENPASCRGKTRTDALATIATLLGVSEASFFREAAAAAQSPEAFVASEADELLGLYRTLDQAKRRSVLALARQLASGMPRR